MTVSFREIVKAAQPTSIEAAQRRLALAQAMQKRALEQPGAQVPVGGPVQAQYGIGHGLTDLATSLMSAYNTRKAEQGLQGANNAQRGQNDALINSMVRQSAGTIMDPAGGPDTQMQSQAGVPESEALKQAMSGIDPQKAAEVLAQAQMQRSLPDPAAEADRALKMEQIKGTLAEREATRQQRITELEMRIEDRKQAGQSAADLQRELAQMRADSAREVAAIRADATKASGGATSAAVEEKKQGRLAALEAAKGALVRMQATSDTLGSGGGYFEGKLPAMGSVAQDFDGAKAQLLATIQSALRVPGIGSQSNMELQALMGALPERTQEKEVRDKQIKGIADRLEIIINRESGNAETPPANAGAGAPPSGVDPKVWGVMTPEERALWQK